jgi:hypothetical protein
MIHLFHLRSIPIPTASKGTDFEMDLFFYTKPACLVDWSISKIISTGEVSILYSLILRKYNFKFFETIK